MAETPSDSIYSADKWLAFLQKTDTELLKLSRTDVFKATGKGGQKRNKTSNAIRLTFFYLVITESKSRSKADNINNAIKKLRMAIALDTRQAVHKRNQFTVFPEEVAPYINNKIVRINPKNPHFPIFTGCLIDVFIKHAGNWKEIGKEFGTTPSQMRRFSEKHGVLSEKLKVLRRELAKNEI